MYPLILEPIFKEMVWGGDKISRFFPLPADKIGEAWVVSCREKEMCKIKNGEFKGWDFIDVINTDRQKYLGDKLSDTEVFPLLLKIIDANDNLSIQVHPNDEYAKLRENYPSGKNEMWYIIDAPEGAELIIGIRDNVTKDEFKKAIESGNLEEKVSYLPVKKGDVVNVPAGLLHAITKGILLLEVQQNSDITYRIYDYNRLGMDGKPRELHVEKSLDVLDFSGSLSKSTTEGIKVESGDNTIVHYIKNDFFSVDEYRINSYLKEESNPKHFSIFSLIEGEPVIEYSDGEIKPQAGESVFIPARLGDYVIRGKSLLIKSQF